MISRFRRDVDDICALLGYYAASCGNCLPTFRDNVSVPSSQVITTRRRVISQKIAEIVFQSILQTPFIFRSDITKIRYIPLYTLQCGSKFPITLHAVSNSIAALSSLMFCSKLVTVPE
jgi:hypothetical protein